MAYTITDILNTEALDNKQHLLRTVFELLAAHEINSVAPSFCEADINKSFKQKLDQWSKVCERVINTLSSCDFDKRLDYDRLTILPFCCRLDGFPSQTYGANLYDANIRVMTILFRDTSRNNAVVLYTSSLSEPVVVGSLWSVDIKPVIKNLNITGMHLITDTPTQKTDKAPTKPVSILSTYYQGNTITVTDLVTYINRIKAVYDKNYSL